MGGFEMPRPGPEHEVLKQMTGAWVGAETLFPSPWSPETRERMGHIRARMLDGFFAISDYEQKSGDEVTFRGHGVYGFDPSSEEYVMYWVDSMGGAGGVARGTLEGNVLTFQNESPMGHHRYRYTFGDGTMRFQMAMSKDGASWSELMDSHWKPA